MACTLWLTSTGLRQLPPGWQKVRFLSPSSEKGVQPTPIHASPGTITPYPGQELPSVGWKRNEASIRAAGVTEAYVPPGGRLKANTFPAVDVCGSPVPAWVRAQRSLQSE